MVERYNATHAPSNEEFQAQREKIAELDDQKREYEHAMRERVVELTDVIRFDPNAFRRALGLEELPPPGTCVICRLNPCGCERRTDRP